MSRVLLSPALLIAVLPALVAAITSVGLALLERPKTIEETKNSISAITVADERLRELAGSVWRVENEAGGAATGFLVEQRYLVTTSALVRNRPPRIRAFRRFGQPTQTDKVVPVTMADSSLGVAVVDLHVADRRVAEVGFTSLDGRNVFDRVFTIGYPGGVALALKEGRIVADRVENPEQYGWQPTDPPVPRGAVVVDIPAPRGMAGAPVFSKDGLLIGLVYFAFPTTGMAFVIPSSYVGDVLLDAKGVR